MTKLNYSMYYTIFNYNFKQNFYPRYVFFIQILYLYRYMLVYKTFQYVYVYCIVLNFYIWGIVYNED